MPIILKNAIIFIRDNPVILFSLLLVVFLPLSLYFYVAFSVNSFAGVIVKEISSHAYTATDLLEVLVESKFPKDTDRNREILQEAIDDIAANGTNLKNIRVIVRDGKIYEAIAAQNREDVGVPIDVSPALNGESLIAYSWVSGKEDMNSEIEVDGQKYQRTIKVFFDKDSGAVYALAAADISISRSMNMLASAVYQGYAIMAVIILFSLILVFQHTRLFSYVGLSKKLFDQNKAKDDFIRMATHELRSPVTVLIAYMETLKDELVAVANDDQRKYIDRMSISIKNLSDLMVDILEVSHLQQGRTDFAPEIVDPVQVIGEIVDGIKQKAQEKGLSLTFDDRGFNYKINVNLICFKRIITNLVENSVKYTPSGKVAVFLAAQTGKRRCVVTVQDTGFGISAEGQNHLFEQFYRVKTEKNAGIPGTGLGLWMSREMARKMGGDILLESIEQMGSRFFVYLSLSDK